MLKLICNRELFAKTFHTVSVAAAGAKADKPILANVRVTERDGKAVLSATDIEIFISAEVDCIYVDSGFDVLLPVGKFHSIISEAKSDEIAIEVTDSEVEISLSGADYTLPTSNPKEFPVFSRKDGDNVTINARAVRAAIRQTSFCADVSSTRYSLGGVHYETDEGRMIFVASDGRRLAHSSAAATVWKTIDGIIPMKAAKAISDICDCDGDCLISADLNAITISVGGCLLNSRLVEGRFPNWRRVIPDKSNYARVPIPAEALGTAVRQAAIVSDKETRGVTLNFSAGTLLLSAATAESGRSKVSVVVSYEGEPVELNIDYRFVGDFCKAVESGSLIDLLIRTHREPMILCCGDSYEYVVMPMAKD